MDKYEYELVLKTDHNTNNYTQWYFFKISNVKKYREYKFHIINFVKPDSSYNEGMKPLVYSVKESEAKENGWYRAGEAIAYFQN